MGFPIEMFTVLFAIPRVSGWLAHWPELLEQDQRIARPRQLYVGAEVRDYVPMDVPASPSMGPPRSPRSTPSPTVRSRGTPPPSACSTAPPTSSGCRPSRPR